MLISMFVALDHVHMIREGCHDRRFQDAFRGLGFVHSLADYFQVQKKMSKSPSEGARAKRGEYTLPVWPWWKGGK